MSARHPIIRPEEQGLMSYTDIARELGCSRQAVAKVEQRALRKLARFKAVFQAHGWVRR